MPQPAFKVLVGERMDPAVVEVLARLGHRVELVAESPASSAFSRPLAIQVDEQNQLRSGVSPFHITEARGL